MSEHKNALLHTPFESDSARTFFQHMKLSTKMALLSKGRYVAWKLIATSPWHSENGCGQMVPHYMAGGGTDFASLSFEWSWNMDDG